MFKINYKKNTKKITKFVGISVLAFLAVSPIPANVTTHTVSAAATTRAGAPTWDNTVSNMKITVNGSTAPTSPILATSRFEISGEWHNNNGHIQKGDEVVYTYSNEHPPIHTIPVQELKDAAGQVAGHLYFTPNKSEIKLVFDTDYVTNEPDTYGNWTVEFDLANIGVSEPPYKVTFPGLAGTPGTPGTPGTVPASYDIKGTLTGTSSGSATPTAGKFQILKSSEVTPTDHLAGANFEIFDSNGKKVDDLTTDANGKAISKLLPAGEYTVRETKAPEGFQLDKTEHKVTVVAGQISTNAVLVNILDKENKVTIVKADRGDQSKHLSGAHFKIVDEQGKVVVTDVVTGDNGEVVVTKLPIGKYFVIETIAPTGYDLDSTPMEINITRENGEVTITALDKVSTNDIPKITDTPKKLDTPKTNVNHQNLTPNTKVPAAPKAVITVQETTNHGSKPAGEAVRGVVSSNNNVTLMASFAALGLAAVVIRKTK